jgi:hypothetical protein
VLIAVPFFGKDPRFLKLLAYWFELHAASETKVPAIVITDDNDLPGFPVLRVDTFPLQTVMRGHPFDRKGAIIVAALPLLGPFLACDVDAFPEKDPERLMSRLPEVGIATVEDDWTRPITMHWNDGAVTVQQNAGVMWFGDVKARADVRRHYLREFFRMGAEFKADDWREQLAWSAVAWQMGGNQMDARLNWSRLKPANPDAVIVHVHGPDKWKRIA